MRTAMQYLRREDRHEHRIGDAHEADHGEEQKQIADGEKVADILPAFAKLLEDRLTAFDYRDGAKVHHEQRCDDGEVAYSIDEEAPAFAVQRDDEAGERRTDQTRNIDDGGIERDRITEVAPVINHFDQEGLAARHVEGVNEAL